MSNPALPADRRDATPRHGLLDALRRGPDIPLERLPQPDELALRTTWRQARVGRIERGLERARQHNPGGWYVVGASTDLGSTSLVRNVGGVEVVLWRDDAGTLVAGPGSCPHMGASLADCVTDDRTLFCRWHGLEIPADGDRRWQPFPAHDDGVLLWVRLAGLGEEPTEAPTVCVRPPLEESIAAVIAQVAVCEPDDIIRNRLDPWHGAWFHPYAFSHLSVDESASDEDTLTVDVAFRLNRTWGVPVRAEFTCPDARTIVMHIVEGEGLGSVVETHATPLPPHPDGRPRTMMTEATIAHSARAGFRVARAFAPLVRPAIQATARRLWVDDLDYAQRRYEVRRRGFVVRPREAAGPGDAGPAAPRG